MSTLAHDIIIVAQPKWDPVSAHFTTPTTSHTGHVFNEALPTPGYPWWILGGTNNTRNYIYTQIVKEQFYTVLLNKITVARTMLSLECAEVSNHLIVIVTWLLW